MMGCNVHKIGKASDNTFGYDGGTFSEKEILNAKNNNTPLTMDLAIPCGCRNNCIFCGYRQPTPNGLTKEDIFSVIDQFKKIGGKSIKFLGEGEPTTRNDILEIIEYIYTRGIKPVLFTCGDIIGEEKICKKIHGISSKEFIDRLYKNNVTIVLKYEKFNEDDIVRKKGFSRYRNKTLKLLKEKGFNKFYPTKLGFGVVVLRANEKEIPRVFKMALENNIYPLLCPLMPLGEVKHKKHRNSVGIVEKDLSELASKLHLLAKKQGIDFVEPADFPGGRPCDISRAGFYIDGKGLVYVCEADEFVGDVKKTSLDKLWKKISKIKNKKYGKCRWEGKCFPKREIGIIQKDYDEVIIKKCCQDRKCE